MKEACGVFGIYAPGQSVATATFDGLYALQHRGQESAGMAVSDGISITVLKEMGLVTRVFDERTLSGLHGDLAIGHTRYSTHGASDWRAAQPVYRPAGESGFAMGHNGNLTNTAALAERAGMLPGMVTSDSDVMAELLAHSFRRSDATLRDALATVLPSVEGAFALVLCDADHIYAVRDPHGFRPLCLGRLGPEDAPSGWVVASESPALDVVGATLIREIAPGELVVIDANGVHAEQLLEPASRGNLCIFEFVYFARPDTRLYGKEVHLARARMGERLARQAPVDADIVMGVPDSGVPAAEGFARASAIPYGQGLVKNRYIGRTFISPDPDARADAVKRKLNPLRDTIRGQRLVVVDDSIVRGTTTKSIVSMLKEAGAKEVHLRISSPPFRWPCFYGIDTPTRTQLLAANMDVAEMASFLEVDSLAFISLENLRLAIDTTDAGFCDACLTGSYPTSTPITILRPDAPTARHETLQGALPGV